MEIQQIKAKMPKAVEYVEEFEKICKHFGFTRKKQLLFCYYHNGIDYVVFGVDTVKQLKENIDLLNKKKIFRAVMILCMVRLKIWMRKLLIQVCG